MPPILLQFLTDDRTLLLLALIAVDLVTGVIAALRTGVFQWQRIADFYRTNVLPGLVGYLLVYVLGSLNADRLPELRGVIELLTQWVGAGLLVAALVASIGSNIRKGQAVPLPPPG
jgi:hypothetical protein